MTGPAPAPKFATEEDVTNRFEGTFPSNRLAWVNIRLIDAENALMGKVPSLRKPVEQVEAESAAAGDADRISRVRQLVADKVLDLFRNPDRGASSVSRTTPDVTISRGWSPDPTRGKVTFTEEELDSVRLRTKRRKRFGMVAVAPWRH